MIEKRRCHPIIKNSYLWSWLWTGYRIGNVISENYRYTIGHNWGYFVWCSTLTIVLLWIVMCRVLILLNIVRWKRYNILVSLLTISYSILFQAAIDNLEYEYMMVDECMIGGVFILLKWYWLNLIHVLIVWYNLIYG